MKSSQQILGLPVLSIEEGKQIGEVKHLVLNPQQGTVDFLLVEDRAWYLGLKALPFKAIQGIGEFALTVQGRSYLSAVTECAGAVDTLEKDLRLPGIKVLSKKGRFLGSISEYFINDNTGKIIGCQLIPDNSEKPAGIIPEKFVLTYGHDFLVVEDGVEEKLVNELQEEDSFQSIEDGVEEKLIAELQEEGSFQSIDDLKSMAKEAVNTAPQISKDEKSGEALKHFEEQQRQYLLGKKVTMRILADNGEVVAEEGEIITGETIERAKSADRYIQLTLNIRD